MEWQRGDKVNIKEVRAILKKDGLVYYAKIYTREMLSEKSFIKIVDEYKKIENKRRKKNGKK